MRNFGMSLNFKDESWRYVLLPLYLATYAYGNKRYQVMVNGQNAIIVGQRPVDWRKISWAIVGMVAPAILLGILSLVFHFTSNRSYFSLNLLAFCVFVIGAGYVMNTLRQAEKMDEI